VIEVNIDLFAGTAADPQWPVVLCKAQQTQCGGTYYILLTRICSRSLPKFKQVFSEP